MNIQTGLYSNIFKSSFKHMLNICQLYNLLELLIIQCGVYISTY